MQRAQLPANERISAAAALGATLEQLPEFLVDARIAGYWAVLSFTALRLCTLITRYARTARLPTTRRLRSAAMLIGAGLSLAAGQCLVPLIWTVPGAGSPALALAYSLLAAVTITAAHDLRQP